MDLGPAMSPVIENLNLLLRGDLDPADPRRPRGRRRRRSRRGRRRARDDQARVRQRPAAPAAASARRPDLLRGAALEGSRGRRAAGDERRVREQRAAARTGDPRGVERAGHGEPATALSDDDRALLERYVKAFEQYDIEALTVLMTEDATQSMPPFDLWLAGTRRRAHLVVRAGDRVRRVARHPDELGERLARVRPVQAERERRGLRSLGDPGAGAVRGADRRASRSSSTPTRSSRSSGCPPTSTRRTPTRPHSSSSSSSSFDAPIRTTSWPSRCAIELQARHHVDRVAASAGRAPTSQRTRERTRGGHRVVDGRSVTELIGATAMNSTRSRLRLRADCMPKGTSR